MNWRRNQYRSETWLEFFGTWALLIAIWFLALGFMGLMGKIMWRVFMMGWNLV